MRPTATLMLNRNLVDLRSEPDGNTERGNFFIMCHSV